MKKLSLFIISVLIGIAAVARPPQLEIEKLFDGSYNTDKTVSIHISKSKDKFFRGFTVHGNPKLVKKISDMFKKDSKNAEKTQEIIDKGILSYSSLEIKNNGCTIIVGLSYSIDDGCYLFIKGSPEAFE